MVFEALLALAALVPPDEKEADAAIEKFKAAIRTQSAPQRAAAVTELSKTPHEKTLPKLLPFLTGDVNTVRIAAAKGLGEFRDFKAKVTPIMIAALPPNDKEVDVVCAIFEGLGKLGDEAALPTIHKTFKDKDAKIAGAALLASGAIRSVTSIDVIIELMEDYEKIANRASGGGGVGVPDGGDDPKKKLATAVLPNTVKAMQGITKEKWATAKEWQIWWSRRKGQNYKVPE